MCSHRGAPDVGTRVVHTPLAVAEIITAVTNGSIQSVRDSVRQQNLQNIGWRPSILCIAKKFAKRMKSKRIWVIVIGLVALAVNALIIFERSRLAPKPPQPPAAVFEREAVQTVYGYDVVREYPHDTQAFTQGLIFLDGYLFESTGGTGRSSLRKVRLETGE